MGLGGFGGAGPEGPPTLLRRSRPGFSTNRVFTPYSFFPAAPLYTEVYFLITRKLAHKSCIKCAKRNAEKGSSTTIKPDGGGIKHAKNSQTQ